MNQLKTNWFGLPYQGVSDKRLHSVRHVESDFPLRKFSSVSEWEAFKAEARKHLLISIGLWPRTEACPLQAHRFDKQDFDGYSTEKVIFQSLPGFYVTGCLYWPADSGKKVPMILNPHGHWENGRFEMSEITRIPTRCVNFALRGMAAFSFDMVGFGDSRQLTHEGYSGCEWDLWNESLLGLQVYNALRALDFVWDLPEVDRQRIGSTGASGGGTQTFWISALDERVSVSMPVNMISTTFQGACICEYAPNLHIDLSNIEIAAMAAPRPMLLAGSTGDWTCELTTATYPYLQSIYALYGKESNVACFYREGPHGYQQSAQEAAYRWFFRQFFGEELSEEEAKEKPCPPEVLDAIRIFGTSSPPSLPPLTHRDLFEGQKERKCSAIQHLLQTEDGLHTLAEALAYAVGDTHVVFTRAGQKEEAEGDIFSRRELLESSQGAQIPAATLWKNGPCPRKVLLFASEEGKAGLFRSLARKGWLDRLLEAGYAVCCADLFLTGEYMRPFGRSGRDFSKPAYSWCEHHFFTAYNYTDTAYRIQDYIGVYRYLSSLFEEVIPAADGTASAIMMAAMPFLPDVRRAYGDLSDFYSCDDAFYAENFFLPAFLNAGGFSACQKLSGITPLPLNTLLEQEAPC